jgi:hypothetical protein
LHPLATDTQSRCGTRSKINSDVKATTAKAAPLENLKKLGNLGIVTVGNVLMHIDPWGAT